jgi:hypothetical protein
MRFVLSALGLAGLYLGIVPIGGCGPTRCEDTQSDVTSTIDDFAKCTNTSQCQRVETPVVQSCHPNLRCAFAIGSDRDAEAFKADVQDLSDTYAEAECGCDQPTACPMGLGTVAICNAEGRCVLN